MNMARVLSVLVLVGALAALGGCNSGMKVTCTNYTAMTVNVEIDTMTVGRRTFGDIAPDQEKKMYVKFDENLLEGTPDFIITLDGGEINPLTKILTIPKVPFEALYIEIRPDEDHGRVLHVRDQDGRPVKLR